MSIPTVTRGLFIKAQSLNDIIFALESSIEGRKDHSRISKLVLNGLVRQINEVKIPEEIADRTS